VEKNNELNKKSGYAVSGVSALLISESVIFRECKIFCVNLLD